MPFQYFRTNQPLALLFYMPWAALAWLPHWIKVIENQPFTTFVYSIFPPTFHWSALYGAMAGMICITLQAWQFNRMINRSEIFGRETQLHGAIYILVASMLLPGGQVTDFVISLFFILSALGKWWQLPEQRNVMGICFDAGIWLGLAAIVSFPNVIFLLLALIALMLFRTFNAREAMFSILGAVLPVLFFFTLAYGLQWPYYYEFDKVGAIPGTMTRDYAWYLCGGFLVAAALFYFLLSTPSNIIRIRKMRTLLLFLLVMSVGQWMLHYLLLHTLFYPVELLVPLAAIISGYLASGRPGWLAWILAYAAWISFGLRVIL